MSVLHTSALGFLLGLRHALEPDHLAAVSTLLSDRPSSRLRALWLGAQWGVGHTLALLMAAAALALLRRGMPPSLALVFDVIVASLLMLLGLRNLTHAFAVWRGLKDPTARLRVPPLLIGWLHGLSGSGVITSMVVAELPTLGAQALYLGLFGVGMTTAMALCGGVLGAQLRRLGPRSRAQAGVSLGTGLLSLLLGARWLLVLQRGP